MLILEAVAITLAFLFSKSFVRQPTAGKRFTLLLLGIVCSLWGLSYAIQTIGLLSVGVAWFILLYAVITVLLGIGAYRCFVAFGSVSALLNPSTSSRAYAGGGAGDFVAAASESRRTNDKPTTGAWIALGLSALAAIMVFQGWIRLSLLEDAFSLFGSQKRDFAYSLFQISSFLDRLSDMGMSDGSLERISAIMSILGYATVAAHAYFVWRFFANYGRSRGALTLACVVNAITVLIVLLAIYMVNDGIRSYSDGFIGSAINATASPYISVLAAVVARIILGQTLKADR